MDRRIEAVGRSRTGSQTYAYCDSRAGDQIIVEQQQQPTIETAGVSTEDQHSSEAMSHNSPLVNSNELAEPVVFIDPVGTRWDFPYEECKTWQSMVELIKEVFVDCFMPSWAVEDLEQKTESNDGNRNFSIIKLEPERSVILESHWDKLVRPGLKFSIEFTGSNHLDLVDRIRQKKAKTLAEQRENMAAEEVQVEEANEVELDKDLTPRSYMVEYYQRDSTTMPDFLCEKSFEKPRIIPRAFDTARNKNIPAVIQEVKKVMFDPTSRPRRETRTDAEYENINEPVVVSNAIIRIHSRKLLNALKDVITVSNPPEKDPSLRSFTLRDEEKYQTSDLQDGVFVFPYKDLLHYKDELSKYKGSSQGCRALHTDEYNRECDEHIDILLEYLYEQDSLRLREVEELWNQKVPKITFSSVWMLLRPGITVTIQDHYGLNAYVVEATEGGSSGGGLIASIDRPYIVTMWNLEFDGKRLERSERRITIPVFDGERDIASLPVVPIKYLDDGEKHTAALIKRGKHFIDIVKSPSFNEYTGPSYFYGTKKFNRARVVVDHSSQPWDRELSGENVLSAVVHIPCTRSNDELSARHRIASCECDTCIVVGPRARRIELDYKDIDLSSTTTLTDHQYLIYWSHVYAFILQDRCWGKFATSDECFTANMRTDLVEVDGLQPPNIQENIIDRLVMDENNKGMIKAICETYSNMADKKNLFFADFIRGKGEGQIMLLHGPPGTGKTLTAESVAEYTKRPLLSVTAADLGHEPEDLEKRLLRYFRHATKWDAIVLLDEADVYLQRRTVHDLSRNSIVSVFLRALDYFQGILFITTNRVGTFDEAFLSRIHLQIGYNALDESARIKIWENNFDKLKNNKKQGGQQFEVHWQVKNYIRTSTNLKDLNWNGREIRNAFQTAVALSTFECTRDGNDVPELTPDHLDQVVQMSRNFKSYMKAAIKASPEDFALMYGLRNDNYQNGQPLGDQLGTAMTGPKGFKTS